LPISHKYSKSTQQEQTMSDDIKKYRKILEEGWQPATASADSNSMDHEDPNHAARILHNMFRHHKDLDSELVMDVILGHKNDHSWAKRVVKAWHGLLGK
jgi:hypothetical protein